MPNYNILKSKMAMVGDTMGDLADYLEQSRVNISAKINGRVAFSLQDVAKIQKKYDLTNSEVYKIFIEKGDNCEQANGEGSCEQA